MLTHQESQETCDLGTLLFPFPGSPFLLKTGQRPFENRTHKVSYGCPMHSGIHTMRDFKVYANIVCVTKKLLKKNVFYLQKPTSYTPHTLMLRVHRAQPHTYPQLRFFLTRSRVNILPRSCSTEHIVHFFQLWVFPICYLTENSKSSDSPSKWTVHTWVTKPYLPSSVSPVFLPSTQTGQIVYKNQVSALWELR